jgi:hypothetical protein
VTRVPSDGIPAYYRADLELRMVRQSRRGEGVRPHVRPPVALTDAVLASSVAGKIYRPFNFCYPQTFQMSALRAVIRLRTGAQTPEPYVLLCL